VITIQNGLIPIGSWWASVQQTWNLSMPGTLAEASTIPGICVKSLGRITVYFAHTAFVTGELFANAAAIAVRGNRVSS